MAHVEVAGIEMVDSKMSATDQEVAKMVVGVVIVAALQW